MSTKKPLENIVREWLSLADDDLQVAKEVAQGQRWRVMCFLSQQAVEKYIKTLLIYRQIPFERTHDIEALIALLNDAEKLDLKRPEIIDLSDYAVDTRYPGHEADHLDKSDADRALEAAIRVSKSIHKALNL